MGKLNAKQRNALPASDFAEPGERKYPVPDRSHAQNALARVSQHGTPAEKAKVRAKVAKAFPGLEQHETHPKLYTQDAHDKAHTKRHGK